MEMQMIHVIHVVSNLQTFSVINQFDRASVLRSIHKMKENLILKILFEFTSANKNYYITLVIIFNFIDPATLAVYQITQH